MLLRRDAVGLALVRSENAGVNATTAAYLGVTGLADHPWGLRNFMVRCPVAGRLAGSRSLCGSSDGWPEVA